MIILNNLTKIYNNNYLFNDVNLSIKDGEFVAIVGDSGSGKTTLLNMMSLLEPTDDGDITIEDYCNPTNNQIMKLRRNIIGNIFQNFALLENHTVKENLKIAVKYNKKKDNNASLLAALAEVGLSNITLNQKIYELSGGEQQRVAIARCILQECKYIFADEPTGNLDQKNSLLVFDLLKRLNTQGRTIVLVTHDLNLAQRCSRIINLN
ncbi:MAG TPA: bacteriocin ABC transporter ATP-binding protein [Firmicutes bacterium]|nr:bacteriocin ABC transporter ATP-binding protein [Bacillota bacterium]